MEVKGGGGVRKLHIIYFLSRMGHVEQPHLFRVRHFSGAGGVYLRDVKRWLADLRGKDMPEAFSWSYKRNYKTGYVWQDLMDDDLITPFSDNEYVLKGSQTIFPITDQRRTPLLREEEGKTKPEKLQRNSETKVKNPEKFSLDQMNGELSERSMSSSDDFDSMKVGEESNPLKMAKPEEEEEGVQKIKTQCSSLYAKLLNSKKKMMEKDKDRENDSMEKEGTPTPTSTISSSSSSSSSNSGGSFTKSKTNTNGASNLLRHWITCGAVDANDAVFIKNPATKEYASNQQIGKSRNEAEIRRGEKIGGSARVLRTCWDQQLEISPHTSRKSCDEGTECRKKRQKECGDGGKMAFSAFKPMAGPNCSQCGKTFRPEKMHSHMKSCRGFKSLSKSASASDKSSSSKSTSAASDKSSSSKSTSAASDKSSSSKSTSAASAYLLTN